MSWCVKMETFWGNGQFVLEIFRYVFGLFADYRLVENPVLFDQVYGFACVAKRKEENKLAQGRRDWRCRWYH